MRSAPTIRALGQVGISLAASATLAAFVPGVAAAEKPSGLRGRTESVRADACTPNGTTCVTLLAVTIDGALAIDPSDLAGLYADYLVQPVSLQDLAAIANRITQRYVAQGYFLSQAIVPSQDISAGLVHLTVLEGRISKITINGPGAAQLKPMLADLEREPIAKLAELDRRLALAGDIPGLSVTSRVVPDPNNPLLHELVVDTVFKQTQLYTEVSNRGAEQVGPWQLFGQASFNALLAPGDQLTLSAMTVPDRPKEFAYLQAGYRYTFDSGAQLSGSLGASKVEDGHNVISQSVGGDAVTASLRFDVPLVRRRQQGLWLGAQFDAGHFENDWGGGGGYRDELRVARVILRGYQTEAGQSSSIALQTSFGLDALGASGKSTLNRSRMNADGSFSKLNLYASHYQDIGSDFGIFASLSGQWTDDNLLLSEQYSLGGASLGRAYSYGELLGDRGIGATLELRANLESSLEPITFLQGYAFYDIGKVWNDDQLFAPSDADLSSAGLGLRVDLYDWLSARMEVAKPLTRTPSDENDRDWRQYLTLWTTY